MQPPSKETSSTDQDSTRRASRLFLMVSFLAWAALLTITATTLLIVGVNGPLGIKMTLALWVPYVLLTPFVLLIVRHAPIRGAAWRKSFAIHLLASLIFVGISEAFFFNVARKLAPQVEAIIMPPPPLAQVAQPAAQSPAASQHILEVALFKSVPKPDIRMVMIKSVANLPLYWVLAALAHAIFANVQLHDRERQATELNALLARSQLAGLRAQLQPHFLFNTLNSISALIPKNAALANQMILNLSELLRMSLHASHRNEIPLSEEFTFLQHYIDIQSIRFADRLRFQLEHDERCLQAKIPALLLQPLIENAIRYGVEPSDQSERILVRARMNKNELQIEIENSCQTSQQDGSIRPPSTGVGLSNSRARLTALHGNAHTFHHAPLPNGGFIVTLTIQYPETTSFLP